MSDRQELATQRDVSLAEILDRALGAGVVITGDITLSLAEIDLVYLNLRLLVSSVGTLVEKGAVEAGGNGFALGPVDTSR